MIRKESLNGKTTWKSSQNFKLRFNLASQSPKSQTSKISTPRSRINVLNKDTTISKTIKKTEFADKSKQLIDKSTANKQNIHPNILKNINQVSYTSGKTLRDVKNHISKNDSKQQPINKVKQIQNKNKERKVLKDSTEHQKFNTSANISISSSQSSLMTISKYIDNSTLKDQQPPLRSNFKHKQNSIYYHPIISLSQFQFIKKLRNWTYFQDWLILHKQTNFIFTMRILSKDQIKSKEMENILFESIKIQLFLNKNQVKGIQKIVTIFDDSNYIYLILQHIQVNYGLQINQCSSVQQEGINLIKNIARILSQIHSYQIILRKIQLSFISRIFDTYSYCKNKRRNSFFGVIQECPPEVIRGESYDLSYDYWTLGLLLYEKVSNKLPFTSGEIQKIDRLQYCMPFKASQKTFRIINGLLNEPQQRAACYKQLCQQEMNEGVLWKDIWKFWCV